MMKIRVFNSEKEGKVNEINLTLATAIDSEYIVGRSPQSGLILDSSDVSRQHGKFFLQNEDYYYSDLGSANGSLINDKLAKKKQSYLLKSGDVIRIGEFVLIMEAISEETEALPATVLNSDWQSFAKIDSPEEVAAQTPESVSKVSEVMAQAPKAVNEVPELVTSESEPLTPAPEELSQGSKVTSTHAPEAAESEVMAPTSKVVSEVYEPEKTYIQEMTYVQPPEEFEQAVVAEATTIQPPEELEAVSEEEAAQSSPVTSTTAPEAVSPLAESVTPAPAAASEDITQTPEDLEEEFEPGELEEEAFEEEIVVIAEATTIQPPEELEAVSEEEAAQSSPVTSATTPETVSLLAESVTPTPEAAASEDITQTPEEDEEEEFEEEIVVVAEVTTLQVPVELEAVPEEEAAQSSPVTSATVPEAASPLPPPVTQAPEAAVSEDIIQTPEEDEEEFEPEELEEEAFEQAVVAEATTIQPPEELEAVSEEEEAESSPVTSVTTPETVSPLAEPVTPTPAAGVSEDITQTSEEEEVESEVMAQPPETTSKAFEIISKKYIALMAHDTKKSELVQFVNQYKAFLSKCLTIATPSISETLYQQTDLAISKKTPLVPAGGYQAIASLVGTGEILAVVLLRDFMVTQSSQANEEALLRLCNINQVLVATNLSTAEAVMHYIKDMVTSL